MRYYALILNVGADEIKEKTRIKLSEYAYDHTLSVVNNYLYKTLHNGVVFAAYREDENVSHQVYVVLVL